MRCFRKLCSHMNSVYQFSTSSIYLKNPRTPTDNSGVYRRLKLISQDEPELEKAGIDQNSIEELEEDFMQAADMHDDVLRKMKSVLKKGELKMTEKKHFKPPKEPGMLTWSEKEQIRFLHQKDPEKWSAEVLAESFPASPEIIKKILKWKWKPASAERVKAHDYQVSKNWVAFHRGKLEVHNPRLKAHLTKFTDRTDGVKVISDDEAKKITQVIMPRPKSTEFVSLVTSFKPTNITEKTETNLLVEDKYKIWKPEESSDSLSILDSSKVDYTLDQFRTRIKNKLNKSNESPSEELGAILKSRNSDIHENTSSKVYVAPSERFKTDAVVYQKSKKSLLSLDDQENSPDRIRIPKDQQKRGQLHRVKDCFYNHDGYFLYRAFILKSKT